MSERNIQYDGLALNFYRKYSDLLDYKFQKEKTFKKKLNNRGALKNYLQFNLDIFKKISVIYELNKSPRNPSINIYYFEPIQTKKEFLGWEEKGFALFQIYMPVLQRNNNFFRAYRLGYGCEIGLHCLSRIIFRGKLKDKVLNNDYDLIFEHFNLLPIMITFFQWFFNGEDAESFFFDIEENNKFLNIPIPTYDGLLMARLFFKGKSNNVMISVRTFIDNADLNEEQKLVKKNIEIIFKTISNLSQNPFINPSSITLNNKNESSYIYDAFRFYYLKELKKIKNNLFTFMSGNNSNLFYRLLKWFDEHEYPIELIDKYKISDYDLIELDELLMDFKNLNQNET